LPVWRKSAAVQPSRPISSRSIKGSN
jgi:hypothetical protein